VAISSQGAIYRPHSPAVSLSLCITIFIWGRRENGVIYIQISDARPITWYGYDTIKFLMYYVLSILVYDHGCVLVGGERMKRVSICRQFPVPSGQLVVTTTFCHLPPGTFAFLAIDFLFFSGCFSHEARDLLEVRTYVHTHVTSSWLSAHSIVTKHPLYQGV